MTRKSFHRLLILIVLMCLLIISWPLFFSHRFKLLDNPFKSVPPFPDHAEQMMTIPASIEPVNQLSRYDIPESLDHLGLTAWAIDVGHFNNKLNALRLVATLRVNGYPAFMQHAENGVIRVYIGPTTEKSKATLLAEHVNTELHLQGLIIHYKPLML